LSKGNAQKSALLVSGAHPSRNPRIVKEANLLSEHGWSVTVLHPSYDNHLALEDQRLSSSGGWKQQVYSDLTRRDNRAFQDRITRFIGTRLRSAGVMTPEALGYGIRRAHRIAGKQQTSVISGHQEVGLWVALKAHGSAARIIDLEDWYSRDLPEVNRPAVERILLEQLERAAISRNQCITTSSSLAGEIASTYRGNKPAVVYNSFPETTPIRTSREPGPLRLVWISQTIGPNRGLELLLTALEDVAERLELALIGGQTDRYIEEFKSHLKPSVRLEVVSPVPNRQIHATLQHHDVGLCLEQPYCANKEFTVSNKIFHYLQAGLRVIATATEGQREISRLVPDRVKLVAPSEAEALAREIRQFARFAPSKKPESGQPLPELFSWEVNSARLLQLFEKVAGTPYRK